VDEILIGSDRLYRNQLQSVASNGVKQKVGAPLFAKRPLDERRMRQTLDRCCDLAKPRTPPLLGYRVRCRNLFPSGKCFPASVAGGRYLSRGVGK